MCERTFTTELARTFIRRTLEALNCGRRKTREELQAELFASKTKMLSYLRLLLGEGGGEKRIYICGYRIAENGARQAIYTRGCLPDVKPPPAKTNAKRWAEVKADAIRHEARRRYIRTRLARQRAVKKPQTPFSALGI